MGTDRCDLIPSSVIFGRFVCLQVTDVQILLAWATNENVLAVVTSSQIGPEAHYEFVSLHHVLMSYVLCLFSDGFFSASSSSEAYVISHPSSGK